MWPLHGKKVAKNLLNFSAEGRDALHIKRERERDKNLFCCAKSEKQTIAELKVTVDFFENFCGWM